MKKFPIILILDGLSSPANIGSLFRLADAFNIEKILLCGPAVDLDSGRLKKTARGTLKTVTYERHEETLEACEEYSSKGYTPLALEITAESAPLHTESFAGYEKIALIIGNENLGVRQELLDLTLKNIHINMFGRNSSMNVAQATAIALYEITRSLPPFN